MILRNLLYATAVIPMNFSAGVGFVVLVSLWCLLRRERA